MKQFMFTKTNKMIKKLLLIICLFVGLNTFAQNRLEFNQVLNISSTGTTNYSLDTVPQNKVWKITSVISEHVLTHVKPVINNITLMDPTLRTFPYWLKEGGVIGVDNNPSYNFILEFSIIEFNIISD